MTESPQWEPPFNGESHLTTTEQMPVLPLNYGVARSLSESSTYHLQGRCRVKINWIALKETILVLIFLFGVMIGSILLFLLMIGAAFYIPTTQG